MSQAVREAIKSKLAADATLSGLATGGIFSDQAPGGTEAPYVIFQKMDGRYQYSFRGNGISWTPYLVKGVSRKKAEAEAIDARCRILLHRQKLTITGHESKSVLIDHDVDYPEESQGDRFDHVGAVYRIATE